MPKASESYNLALLRPDLARQWHPTRNGALGPKDVTPGSRRKVWWLCEQGHWFLASVSDRIRGKKCTYCSGLKKQGDQVMADVRPELLREWHPSKNKNIKAREVLCTHGDKLWWLCERGHEWLARVKTRLQGKGCPFCSSLIAEDFTAKRRKTVMPPASLTSRVANSTATNPIGSLPEQMAVHHRGKDLRRSQRYEHVSTVMIESIKAGLFGYAQIHNYSAGGMLIGSDFPIGPGTLVRVRLETPLYALVSNVVDSRVVWCRKLSEETESSSRFGIGVALI